MSEQLGQQPHAALAAERAQHPPGKGLWFNLTVTAIEVGGALLLFRFARSAGVGEVGAYLIGSIAPVVGALLVWIRARKFSGASATIFAFAVLSAAVAVIGSTEPKVLLYKDCAVTAVIGLIFGASCLAARPVVFYFAQRWGTDGTREGMEVFDQMWRSYPQFRRAMYLTSLAWAGAFLVQAGVTAVIVASTPFDTGYLWDQILPFVAAALAAVATVRIMRRSRARSKETGSRC